MEQNNGIGHERKGKHLNREERLVIERMSRAGRPALDIAEVLGRHQRTIERELKRGTVEHKDSEWRIKTVYNSDRGQDVHDLNATAKGPELKLGANYDLVRFIHRRILEHKESPDVVAFRIRQSKFDVTLCTKTLYNYIDQGLIDGVSNETLWEKRYRSNRTRRSLCRHKKRPQQRESIESRPEHIDQREEFGHWEMDLVVGPTGRSNAVLLTLVERKHRQLITRKLPDKTQESVLIALKRIEREHGTRRFRQVFKSITVDNGSEFLDVEALQASAFSLQQRTRIFYAHPYSSWERGSNENVNRMLRRFVAKGRDIARFTKKRISEIEDWINNYPRRILEFMTPHELFTNELKAIV